MHWIKNNNKYQWTNNYSNTQEISKFKNQDDSIEKRITSLKNANGRSENIKKLGFKRGLIFIYKTDYSLKFKP